MTHEISLSEDEVRIIRRALERELENSRLEHRHTRSPSHCADVKQHVQGLGRLLNVTFSDEHLAVHE